MFEKFQQKQYKRSRLVKNNHTIVTVFSSANNFNSLTKVHLNASYTATYETEISKQMQKIVYYMIIYKEVPGSKIGLKQIY